MKTLLLSAAALFLCAVPAMANDAPPANPPPPPTQTAPTPAPEAKKEDEDELSSSVGFFTKLFGKKNKAPTANTNDIGLLRGQIDDLNATIGTLTAQNEQLLAEREEIEKNWQAIETALAIGDAKSAALQTGTGKKAASAVQTATISALQRSGHDPARLPGPGAKAPEPAPERYPQKAVAMGDPEWKGISADYWASRMPDESKTGRN